jgi:hypothetical protein
MNRHALDPGFDPRIADWLEDDPDRAPDAVLETVLAAFPSIPQRRAVRMPWRFPPMTLAARLSAGAIAIAILAVGGVMILQPRGPSVGNPASPSPSTSSPSAPTSPSASAFASRSIGVAPATTLGDWQAITDSGFGPYFSANQRIQLSIDWQTGEQTWIQTLDGKLILKSNVLTSPAGEIDVAGTAGSDGAGCAVGDLGRYTWSRTADGLYLTLTAIEDACPNRLAAMSRTWVHSLSAVTDGKRGVFPFGNGWLEMTLPAVRFGLSGGTGLGVLSSMDGPARSLAAFEDPLGFKAPCANPLEPKAIPTTTAGIVTYLEALPGFVVTKSSATVGGVSAVHVTLGPTQKGAAGPCIEGEIAVFHGRVAGEDTGPRLAVDKAHSIWILDRGGHVDAFIYEGEGVRPAEELSVIHSFQFLDTVPTP